jgi:hypothetical protein
MMPLTRERDTAEAEELLAQVQERGSIRCPNSRMSICVCSPSHSSP